MTDNNEYYDDDDYDSVYANNAILDLANVSVCLQHESLHDLLMRDKHKVEKEDSVCAWYHSKISRESAEALLKEGLSKLRQDGLFLVRDSTSSAGDFVLSVTHNARVYQFQLKEKFDCHYQLDEGPIVQGLEKLINYYHGDNTGLITKLTQHCQGSAPPPKARTVGPTTLLHRAVLEGDEKIVADVLKDPLCPDVNAKNEWGTTALHDSCKYGFIRIAELLLEHKADVEMKDRQGLTPLHRSCAANRPQMISVLIKKGKAKSQTSSPKTAWVPMHDAAMRGYGDCIKELLKFNAVMWPRAEDEQTPLDLAMKYNRGSCIQILKSEDKRPIRTRKEDWFHPNLNRQEAHDLFDGTNKTDGLFLVRPSRKNPQFSVITFCHKRTNYNFEVKTKEYTNANRTVFFIDNGPYFDSLERLIEHYSREADGMTTRLTASINVNQDIIPMDTSPNADTDEIPTKATGIKRSNTLTMVKQFEAGAIPKQSDNERPATKTDIVRKKLNLVSSETGAMVNRLESVLSNVFQAGMKRVPIPVKRPVIQIKDEGPVESAYSEPEITRSPPPLPPSHPPQKQARPQLESRAPSVDKPPDPGFKKIIDAKDIKLGIALGEGEFGEVKKAVYVVIEKGIINKKKKIDVAVKTFHQNEAGAAFESINREATLMQDLDHPCIVKLFGICQHPFMLVEEFVPKGALADYLLKKKVDVDPTLYLWAAQIASGMEYLEERKIVHRDLAARNILIESEKQCKISDFGLSRAYEEESNYYKASKGGRWPIKWYAPECVNFGKFTHATDVWSYGVTLWEMFSYGMQPYEEMKGIEVIQYIESGQRLKKPDDCPDIVYKKMVACWEKDPKKRLTFSDLHNHFQSDPEYASALDIQRQRKAMASSRKS